MKGYEIHINTFLVNCKNKVCCPDSMVLMLVGVVSGAAVVTLFIIVVTMVTICLCKKHAAKNRKYPITGKHGIQQ